jgi:hypothetical protein
MSRSWAFGFLSKRLLRMILSESRFPPFRDHATQWNEDTADAHLRNIDRARHVRKLFFVFD